MSSYEFDVLKANYQHFSSPLAAKIAAYLRLHTRRSLTYASIGLALMSRRAGKTGHEASKINEVLDAQEPAAIAQRDFRIWGEHVRPLPWH